MPLLHTHSNLLDQLWKGAKPLLQTRAATVALQVVRRNPKTAIALGLATAAGVLFGAIAKRRRDRRESEARLLPGRRSDALPGYIANPASTNGSPAMTQ